MTVDAREGPGRFQWGAGSWFGTQVGATLWIPLLGVMMLLQGRTAGWGIVALAVAVNALGFYLWSRRATTDPYPALQILLGSSAVAAVVAVLVASAGAFELTPSLPTLLVYPGLMGVVYLQERAARSGD